jgi:hypothetical protein
MRIATITVGPYSHAIPAQQEEAAARVAELVFEAGEVTDCASATQPAPVCE